jgi:hypothetical protein
MKAGAGTLCIGCMPIPISHLFSPGRAEHAKFVVEARGNNGETHRTRSQRQAISS